MTRLMGAFLVASLSIAQVHALPIGDGPRIVPMGEYQPIERVKTESGREFSDICRAARLPGLIESSETSQIKTRVGELVEIKPGTLKKALNQAVGRHPGFQWSLISTIVYVYPKRSGSKELERRIGRLSLTQVPADEAFARILAAANISATALPVPKQRFSRVSMKFEDVSVREALLLLAGREKDAVWMLWPKTPGKWEWTVSSWRKERQVSDFVE